MSISSMTPATAQVIRRRATSSTGKTQRQEHRLEVGVIGAGISGLVMATHLQASLGAKAIVTVLDWGRGPGGRTATRRVLIESGEEVAFDHANPFFSVESDVFTQELLAAWQKKGLVEEWRPRLGGDGAHFFSESKLWVGTPSNHAVCKSLSEELLSLGGVALSGRHVKHATFKDQKWYVSALNRLHDDCEQWEWHRFDALVVSEKLLGVPNQYAILEPADARVLGVPEVLHLQSSGQIILLLAFDPPLKTDVDLIRTVDGPLELLVRDSSKPGRSFQADVWTARSSSSYTAQHLRGDTEHLRFADQHSLDNAAAVLEDLVNHFKTLTGSAQDPTFASVFTWDHALPVEQIAGKAFALDPVRRLGLCGDFFQPGQEVPVQGLEAASLSGLLLAKELEQLMSAQSSGVKWMSAL